MVDYDDDDFEKPDEETAIKIKEKKPSEIVY